MTAPLILHASTVALGDRAVLIRGAAGSGKSTLALHLIQLGATLIADDRTEIHPGPIARCPAAIKGLIEARGIGLLNAATQDSARIVLTIDLDRTETERLPHPRVFSVLNHAVPEMLKVEGVHFPFAIMQYLRHGPAKDSQWHPQAANNASS